MKNLFEVLKMIAALSVIIAACVLVFTGIKKPVDTLAKNADSLEAIKPTVRFVKKTAQIDAVTLFEFHMKNGDVVYMSVSNSPGVTTSVGLSMPQFSTSARVLNRE